MALIKSYIKNTTIVYRKFTNFVIHNINTTYWKMSEEVVIQTLQKNHEIALDKAITYYSVLCTLNNIKLQKRQLELLAFTAIRGTITPQSAREEFAKLFDTSLDTIENLKGQLTKMGLLINDNKMYRVNPEIMLDFSKPIFLIINLTQNVSENSN